MNFAADIHEGQYELPSMIDELRGILATASSEGQLGDETSESLLNIGFLLGSCVNVEPDRRSMTLFNRLHRLHSELVTMGAPATVMECLQRIYMRAFALQIKAGEDFVGVGLKSVG